MADRSKPGPAAPKQTVDTEFLNPYNFVSAPSRTPLAGGPLGDRPPATHGVVETGTYSARIPITLTTRSPLLLPDQAGAGKQDKQPKTLATRRDPDGNPVLSGSTVKGMLRSAYEAITNSRYGVFDSRHKLPGAIRTPARDVNSCPGVVREVRPDGTVIVDEVSALVPLVNGCRYAYVKGKKLEFDPMPAPLLPIEEVAKPFARALGVEDADLDMREVWAWIHFQDEGVFQTWKVSDLASSRELLPDVPSTTTIDIAKRHGAPVRVRAIVHWTDGKFGIKSTKPKTSSKQKVKVNERLVVQEIDDRDKSLAEIDFWEVVLDKHQVDEWDANVASYVRAHENETDSAKTRLATYIRHPERWTLRKGRTLHIRYSPDGSTQLGTTPAMIGRDVFACSPRDLEQGPGGHLPATELDEMSPADRVFGWVSDSSDKKVPKASKGHLRVSAPRVVSTTDTNPIEKAPGNPHWLQTLNGPKPSQYRFYGLDGAGNPHQGTQKSADNAFRDGDQKQGREPDRLRGRKFYLPHRDVIGEGSEKYWRANSGRQRVPVRDHDRFPEHMASSRDKPDIAVAVKDWVRMGTVFEAELIVDNLSGVELGALLWLLTLPDDHVFTVGLGRPLGFGAVRVEAKLADVTVHDSRQLRARYTSLISAAAQLNGSANSNPADEVIIQFNQIVDSSSELSTVRTEFLHATAGYPGYPVHYPRPLTIDNGNVSSRPTNEIYQWWVANEKPGNYHALGRINSDRPPTLPYLGKYTPPNKGGTHRQKH